MTVESKRLRQKEASRRWRLKHPERVKEIVRRWKDKNRERFNREVREKAEKDRLQRGPSRGPNSEWAKKNPEKWRAHSKMHYEARKGRFEIKDTCEKCGVKKKIQAHHEDYSKPLDVVWLCPRCHSRRHMEIGGQPSRRVWICSKCGGDRELTSCGKRGLVTQCKACRNKRRRDTYQRRGRDE